MALRHIALKTRDLEKTRRFYVDHLGLREDPNDYTVELYAD